MPDLLHDRFRLSSHRMRIIGKVAGKTMGLTDRLSRLLVIAVSIGLGQLRLMPLTFNTTRVVS